MTVPVEELLWKLRLVESAVPDDIRNDWNFFGLRVDETGTTLSIAKREYPNGNDATATVPLAVDTRLARTCEFRAARIAAGLQLAPTIDTASMLMLSGHPQRTDTEALCEAGDYCYAVDGRTCEQFDGEKTPRGTIGWFFYLDGVLVGLGNYHILCPLGDDTPAYTTQIFRKSSDTARSDFEIGTLLDFVPQSVAKPVLDCALVAITDPDRVCGRYRRVDPPRDYPMFLADGATLTTDRKYYLVGAQSALQGRALTFSFSGVGSRKFVECGTSWLYEQLFFDQPNQGGDSGAVVVDEEDNRVVGINVARDSRFTIASPLYRLRWTRGKERPGPVGTSFPEFFTGDGRFPVHD